MCQSVCADNTRNIVGSPISGIDPQELIDTRQLCKDINTMIIGEDQTSPEFANLPRKFNIGMYATALRYFNYTLLHTALLCSLSHLANVLQCETVIFRA
jgi:Nitrite and sulphite reductase 4Fe-4S domain